MTYKKDWTKIPAQYQDFRPFFYEGFKNAESIQVNEKENTK